MKNRSLGLLLSGVALTAFVGSHLLFAKEAAKDDAPKTFCNDLMAKLKADDLAGFFTMLETDPIAPAQKPTDGAKQAIKFQRDEFAKQSGKPVGEVELVRTETIGKSFVRLTYLDKFERNAMTWQFVFYKTGDAWKVTGLNWTGNPTALFADAR